VSVKVYAHTRGATAVEEVPVARLRSILEREDAVVWVDVRGHDENDIVTHVLGETLGVHPLVLEDVFLDAPQPKIEAFDDYLYAVVHGLDRNAESPDHLETIELDLVLGPRWLVTQHPKELRSTESVEAEIRKSAKLFAKGPTFIAHAILDHLFDHYGPLMDRFDDELESLEAQVLAKSDFDPTLEVFALKRSLTKIRRTASHQRDVVLRVARGEFDHVDESALPFFRDLADHFVRVVDRTEGFRDQLSAISETYRAIQGQRLNEVMKLLTILSTIMLPLTFIAGVYGMNFEAMPELHWRYGYVFALAMMALTAVALIAFFRRRGWL
jgi:magnesium transporter